MKLDEFKAYWKLDKKLTLGDKFVLLCIALGLIGLAVSSLAQPTPATAPAVSKPAVSTPSPGSTGSLVLNGQQPACASRDLLDNALAGGVMPNGCIRPPAGSPLLILEGGFSVWKVRAVIYGEATVLWTPIEGVERR